MKSHSFVSDNRYSPLKDFEGNRTEFSVKYLIHVAIQLKIQELIHKLMTFQLQTDKSRNRQEIQSSLLVIVLSTQVDRRKMSSNKTVKVRSFPGATTEDMADYLRSLLRNNPSSLIIHIDTNNLKNDGMYTLRNKLLDLKDSIEEQFSNTEVMLSTLTKRTDDPILEQKVNKVNGLLLDSSLDVVNNNNISHFHLNRSKLHLKYAGTALIAKNFIDKIRTLQ